MDDASSDGGDIFIERSENSAVVGVRVPSRVEGCYARRECDGRWVEG